MLFLLFKTQLNQWFSWILDVSSFSNSQIYPQLTCADFDQLVGLKINPENRWIKKAAGQD
ncbi:hypothetical protein [Enterococcus lemanii]|uniref:Uncharacterized protein n=1 Tax=Enterococcus lemanii TaxID=1159752 RepID=A0ABV9MVN1_9ENTE|nr:hypothetical protein [Enterococcus lemanii]